MCKGCCQSNVLEKKGAFPPQNIVQLHTKGFKREGKGKREARERVADEKLSNRILKGKEKRKKEKCNEEKNNRQR